MINPIALLSSNVSTVIPSYVSILSSLIFTVISLNDLPSTFLTFIFSLLSSGSDVLPCISLASTLNLL